MVASVESQAIEILFQLTLRVGEGRCAG